MPNSYSVNQLKSWSKCQKKYELDYVRQLRWPSNPKNFRLGRSVHQLLDYEARGLPIDHLLEVTDGDIRASWQTLHASRWSQLPTLASEWGFSLFVGGNWLYGRIDRIVQDDDRVIILDWKTGTSIPFAPEADWQTIVYLYAVYEAQRDLNLAISYEQLQFTYVQANKGQIKDVTVPYSEAMHTQTAQRLTTTMHAIENAQHYALPPKCPDKFCPYFNTCGINATIEPEEVTIG